MPLSEPGSTSLRDLLADRYPRRPDIERIVNDAGLKPAWIAWDERPINTWQSILDEARDRGRMEALIGLVLRRAPGDKELKEAVQTYRSWNIGTLSAINLPDDQYEQLLSIIDDVTLRKRDWVYQAYRAVLPSTAHIINTAEARLLLANLCEQPWIEGWPPLFGFVERLALIDVAVNSRCQEWVDANALALIPPLPRTKVDEMRAHARQAYEKSSSLSIESYLQLYLEPDWGNRTEGRKLPLFRIELVLWSPKTNGPLVLFPEESPLTPFGAKQLWTLDELPDLLDWAFGYRDWVAWVPDLRKLLLEIIAPSHALLYNFERWIRNGQEGTYYGAVHPLVIRLQDRLTIPYPADQQLADAFWRAKWNVFNGGLRSTRLDHMEWRKSDQMDVYELQDNDNLACLGVSNPLFPENRDIFDALRDAGVPVAILLRGSSSSLPDPTDVKQYISTMLANPQLGSLHTSIQTIRRTKQAREDPAYIGNALILLWDDPDRLPPKYSQQGVFI